MQNGNAEDELGACVAINFNFRLFLHFQMNLALLNSKNIVLNAVCIKLKKNFIMMVLPYHLGIVIVAEYSWIHQRCNSQHLAICSKMGFDYRIEYKKSAKSERYLAKFGDWKCSNGYKLFRFVLSMLQGLNSDAWIGMDLSNGHLRWLDDEPIKFTKFRSDRKIIPVANDHYILQVSDITVPKSTKLSKQCLLND
ncbi:unnamed protein product [Thelazia callipaeda]|uniref:C-type lectin domain-containing protein n=1 Tax=Thelazia callipaeda TaxID=103827 RepID=A0A0N5D3Q7_THECL|nr:unnamed protein product [Thelazia callipaeda]